ncbi:MAG: beta-Ig-H3/fasciclin, partial [Cyanobacteria bacterium J06638_6]
PAYLGVGGNIGIGNRGQTGVSSFGFNVISKISLGPRFSLRPGVTITNDRSSFTIPLTYNFNTLSFSGFRAQPYVGAGVDVPTSGDVGLLVNAGADVPISRDFTLNGAANFRVTSGFGLGISLGVGYNFPFIFE